MSGITIAPVMLDIAIDAVREAKRIVAEKESIETPDRRGVAALARDHKKEMELAQARAELTRARRLRCAIYYGCEHGGTISADDLGFLGILAGED